MADTWKFELLQTMFRHERTIWDGLEFFCALVPDEQISRRQVDDIMRSIVEKGKGSLAGALLKALELMKE